MGRLNEQGLQRLVNNIKEDVNTRFETVNTEVENTKGDILGIQNELDKSKRGEYQTENGIKEFESKDGYIDNISMEGKTLINVGDIKQKGWNTTLQDCIRTRFYVGGNKPYEHITNGVYTFYNFTDKVVSFPTLSDGDNSVWGTQVDVQPRSCKIATIPSGYSCVGADFWIRNGWKESDMDSISSNYVMVIQGEHKYMSYFRGLKSIGQEDGIELICGSGSTVETTWEDDVYILPTDGSFVGLNDHCVSGHIEIDGDTFYTIVNTSAYMCYFDKNKNVIPTEVNSTSVHYVQTYGRNVPNDCGIYSIKTPSNAKFIRCTSLPVAKDKFKISRGINIDIQNVHTTLRSLPNGVRDTIEKRGNKYYKIQRCGEYVFTDVENWTDGGGNNQTDVKCFRCSDSSVADAKVQSSNLPRQYSDKFKVKINTGTDEATGFQSNTEGFIIATSGSNVYAYVRISHSKLSSVDVASFKMWIKENPITVVYELADPIITELPNFNPRTFLNKTAVLINSGAVQGDITFDVTSSLGSRIDVMSDKMTTYDTIASNFRNILFSTELPTDNQGNDGDIWIKYI